MELLVEDPVKSSSVETFSNNLLKHFCRKQP